MSLHVYLGILVLFIMSFQVLMNFLQRLLSVSFLDILAFRKVINVILPQRKVFLFFPPLKIAHLFNKSFLYHYVIPWLFLQLKLNMKMTLFNNLFSPINIKHK